MYMPCSSFRTTGASAFTLVELIIVITILAILGTLGFVSLWSQSSKARDSSRIADAAQLAKSLDLAIIQLGSYPQPDGLFTLTYSGGAVWYQGTAGSGVVQKLHWAIPGGGLDSRPSDPLKSTEFAYSTLAYGNAYQIKVYYEGDTLTASNLLQTAYAAPWAPTVAYVRGNYGGLAAKTQTGGWTYVLALPSIMTNTGSAGQTIEISANALSGTLLLNGKDLTGGSSFNPNVVVFSGAALPTNDSTGAITAMATNLKTTYSSSDLSNYGAVQQMVSTTTGSLAQLGTNIIVNQLGGKIGTTTASTVAVAWVAVWSGYTCAVTTAGGTKCWGVGTSGQLGNGMMSTSSTPVDVSGLASWVGAVTAWDSHACVRTTAGGVKCWGYNAQGQLGNGTTSDSLTPVDVSGLASWVAAIYAWRSHTCAVTTAGGVKCWGLGLSGQLGNGASTNSSVPVDVSGLASWVAAVAAWNVHACAMTTAGGVKCWGSNTQGQLGNGTTTSSPTPVDVSGLASWVAAVAVWNVHACVRTTVGGVKCWGYNTQGQLGNGTTTNSSVPVDVTF